MTKRELKNWENWLDKEQYNYYRRFVSWLKKVNGIVYVEWFAGQYTTATVLEVYFPENNPMTPHYKVQLANGEIWNKVQKVY